MYLSSVQLQMEGTVQLPLALDPSSGIAALSSITENTRMSYLFAVGFGSDMGTDSYTNSFSWVTSAYGIDGSGNFWLDQVIDVNALQGGTYWTSPGYGDVSVGFFLDFHSQWQTPGQVTISSARLIFSTVPQVPSSPSPVPEPTTSVLTLPGIGVLALWQRIRTS